MRKHCSGVEPLGGGLDSKKKARKKLGGSQKGPRRDKSLRGVTKPKRKKEKQLFTRKENTREERKGAAQPAGRKRPDAPPENRNETARSPNKILQAHIQLGEV